MEDNVIASNNILIDLSFETPNDNPERTESSETVTEQVIDTVTENITAQKTRNKFKWVTHSEYDSLDDALDFLDDEGFIHYDDSHLKIGQKFYFRCKKTPKTLKPYCVSRFVLFLPSNSNKIILLFNGNEHDHIALMAGKKRVMSDEMVDYLNELFDKGVTQYSAIIKFIDEERSKHGIFSNEPNPDARQIEYRLRKYRNSEIKSLINLGDLMEWCEQRSSYPVNDNEAFVLAYESSTISEELHFHFSITTPALMEKFIGLETICIDATYKLNWNGFPLIVLGTVDRQKTFHPLLYACSSHETTDDYSFVFESLKNGIECIYETEFEPKKLIADGAIPIRNAFYNVFVNAELDIMCFAHVIRNIRKRPFASKNNKPLILDEIRKMQSAPSRPIFDMMSKLFCQKWKPLEPSFIEYFQSQWLGPLANWFEGAAQFTPSTNNALESHNATIKRKITLRRRLPLNKFLVAMKDLTECVSNQFSSGTRKIATETNIKKPMNNLAAIMYQNGFKCFKAKRSTDSVFVFLVPSQRCNDVNANEIYYKSLVRRQWKSFDEFLTYGFQMFYIVQLSKESWKTESSCTCVSFFKENICKHIIAIGMREKIIQCPQSANPTSLSQYKRKAGPAQKAKKALQFQ